MSRSLGLGYNINSLVIATFKLNQRSRCLILPFISLIGFFLSCGEPKNLYIRKQGITILNQQLAINIRCNVSAVYLLKPKYRAKNIFNNFQIQIQVVR